MGIPDNIQVLIGHQDFSDDCEDLEISEVSPGGFDTASFTTRTLPEFTAHVTIRDIDAQLTIYTGRVSTVGLHGSCFKVTCKAQGVWTTDRRVKLPLQGVEKRFNFEDGTLVTDIIRQMFGLLCPDVYDSGHIVDSELQLSEDSPDMSGWTFADVMQWATGLTSFLGTPLTWHIRNCGMADYGCLYVAFVDDSMRLQIDYNDTFESTFDDQAFANTSSVKWGNNDPFTVPEGNSVIDYSVIKVVRDLYNNASNNVRVLNDAKALAYAYYSRFSEWRSTSDSISIDCNEQKVVATSGSPLMEWVTYPQEISPWLVPCGIGCGINHIPTLWGRYGQPNIKYLTSRRYNFTTGKLDLGFGQANGFSSEIKLIEAFVVNRPTVVVEAVGGQNPLVNQDTTEVFGPSFSTTTVKDPSLTTGVPVFATEGKVDEGPMLNGGVVHPNIIADEGLEANFPIGDLTTAGYKPGIKVIPGIFNEIEVQLWGDNGLVQDTVFIKLYKLEKGSSTVPIFLTDMNLNQKRTTIRLSGNKEITIGPREWLIPFVSVGSSTALWANVSMHAKRDYPDLKLT